MVGKVRKVPIQHGLGDTVERFDDSEHITGVHAKFVRRAYLDVSLMWSSLPNIAYIQ